MSLWGKKSAKRPNAPAIRIEKVPVKPSPQPVTKMASRPQVHSRAASSRPSPRPLNEATAKSKLKPRRAINPRKRSPAIARIESDSDDDGDDSSASFDFGYKKAKTVLEGVPDGNRQLSSLQAFSEDDAKATIHAVDLASLKKKFVPAFGAEADEVSVEFQYPGAQQRERYELVYKKREFDPVEEIMDVINDVADFFVPAEHIDSFQDASSGIIRRLQRAKGIGSISGFKEALEKYNMIIGQLSRDGSLLAHINQKHSLPYSLVHRIMKQTYDRAVSPKVDILKKYENGTDTIYGELEAIFVYNILVETGITSDQVFVDLGSGVANVVLQAALQIGCESWGGEIMENACTLAEAQKTEFEARCRLWGLEPGAVRLEQGDFMESQNIRNALKRADVVLVNNEVFTPSLNNDLINLFLDLKDGCRIVSLKSFVPHNHKITSYNLNNPVNLLDVEQKEYSEGSVSWKSDGGHYFIATKNSKRLQSYEHLS